MNFLEPVGQVFNRQSQQRWEQSFLPQDEGRLLQVRTISEFLTIIQCESVLVFGGEFWKGRNIQSLAFFQRTHSYN